MRFKIVFSWFMIFCVSAKASEFFYAKMQLNVRSGPAKTYSAGTSIPKGTKVEVDTVISGWGRIIFDEEIMGFASMKYLTKNPNDINNSDTKPKKDSTEKKDDSPWKTVISIVGLIILLFYSFTKKGNSTVQAISKKTVEAVKPKFSPPPKPIEPKVTYYCEYCGSQSNSVSNLTKGHCIMHPSGANAGKHSLYQGSEKAKYTCKYCGSQSNSITNLTHGHCIKHPNGSNAGKHSPAL